MNKHLFYCLLMTFIVFGVVACKKNNKKAEVEIIVSEWTDKEIIFPADLQCAYFAHDTVCPEEITPYKILLYTDSTGCTSCKLQLHKWNSIIEEADTLMPGKISFLFFFQPKDEKELKYLLRKDHFAHTVYLDKENIIYDRNHFPGNINYQCFLLDKDNRVLLIGNPTLNPKIWNLYKKTIMGERNEEHRIISYTVVEVEQPEIDLQNTKVHKPSVAKFVLKNTGDSPLVIKDITTSCGCTVPAWDKKPIKPGEKTEIKVKVTPDSEGYFRKTVTLFCNTKEGTIPLSVKSIVNK